MTVTSHTSRYFSSLALLAAFLGGCGDPQLNESRQGAFFVSSNRWQTSYGPGLTVLSPFPELADAEDPRFVSNAPSVVAVELVEGVFAIAPSLRLRTGSTGSAEISLYDGDRFVRSETVEVVRPRNWRFDLRVQNEVAPLEAEIAPDEAVYVWKLGRVFARVDFSQSLAFDAEDAIVSSGRIEAVSGGVVQLLTEPLILGDERGVFRFNQLSSGDFVSVIATLDAPRYVLRLPSGELVAGAYPLAADFVVDLEVVVSEDRDTERADIAVFGVVGGRRVLGLAPAVTLDDQPVRQFRGPLPSEPESDDQTWPWLFSLSPESEGTLRVSWDDQVKVIELSSQPE